MKKAKKKQTIKKSCKKIVKKKSAKKATKKVKKIAVPKTKISQKLLKMLGENKIKYEIIPHKTVFTAYDLAQTLKVKLNEVTKTLVLKVDKNYLLALLPGHLKLDFGLIKKIAKVKSVGIISEKEMTKVFKVTPGAITPFGCLYNMPVYLEKSLLRTDKALFQSGSFNEAIKMRVKDFVKLEEPVVGIFGKK